MATLVEPLAQPPAQPAAQPGFQVPGPAAGTSPVGPAEGPGGAAPPHLWLGLSVILAAMILNILDSTIVNVAAPAIQLDLSMSTSALEWIAAGYTLALGVGLMTGACLGDVLGRRRMMLTGLTGF